MKEMLMMISRLEMLLFVITKKIMLRGCFQKSMRLEFMFFFRANSLFAPKVTCVHPIYPKKIQLPQIPHGRPSPLFFWATLTDL